MRDTFIWQNPEKKLSRDKSKSSPLLLVDHVTKRNGGSGAITTMTPSTMSETLRTTGNEIIPQRHGSIIKILCNEALTSFCKMVNTRKGSNVSDNLGKESFSKGKRSSYSPNHCSNAKCWYVFGANSSTHWSLLSPPHKCSPPTLVGEERVHGLGSNISVTGKRLRV